MVFPVVYRTRHLRCVSTKTWVAYHRIAYHLTVPVALAIARLVRKAGAAPRGTKAVTPDTNNKAARKERKDLMVVTVG